MKFTPDCINRLDPNEVFVFGSNLAGVHGAGAAKTALLKFGARLGIGRGLQGNSYAFPTKDENLDVLPLISIEAEVRTFLIFADSNRHLTFFVTKVGCGLSRYNTEHIAKLFANYAIPTNVILPREFWEVINSIIDTKVEFAFQKHE